MDWTDAGTWAPALLVAGALYSLCGVGLARQQAQGAREMGLALVAIGVWVAGAAAEALADEPTTFTLCAQVKYTAIAVVPPWFFLFYLRYSGREIGALAQTALWLVPALTITFIWTNPLHEWMWRHPPVGPDGELLVRPDWGPWFWWGHTLYSYAITTISFVALAARIFDGSHLLRAQVPVVLGAALLPFASNALYLAGFGSDTFSLTPVAFAGSGLGFAWGFFRVHLFRTYPVAYGAVFQAMEDAVVVVDDRSRLIDANPVAEQLLGEPVRALVGREVAALPSIGPALAEWLAARGERPAALALPGERRLEIYATPVGRGGGSRIVILRDETARHAAEEALRRNEAMLRGIVDHSPNGILRLRPVRDAQGRIRDFVCIFANPMAGRILQREREALEGQRFRDAVPPHTALLFEVFRDCLRTGRVSDVERCVETGEGDPWFRFIAAPAGGDLSVTFIDITARKRHELRIEAAAVCDPLTGLLNRRGFEQDAAELVRRLAAERRPGALFFFDLDGFKEINDAYGHEAGDTVLQGFARRVQEGLRSDALFARLGGDEFVLLVPDLRSEDAAVLGERFLSEAGRPHLLPTRRVTCPASIGITMLAPGGEPLSAALRRADEAMYAAKSGGGGLHQA